MKNIFLVLGISGNVSLGILRVLRKNFKEAYIIGACVNDSFNNIYCDEFIKSPYADDADFTGWLIDLCNKKNVQIVFSGVEEVIRKIVFEQDEICENSDAELTFSSVNCLSIGNDKKKTVEWLKNNGFNYPNYFSPESKNDIVDYFSKNKKPIILKPIIGKGSQEIYKIMAADSIANLNINYNDYIAQELIGNELEEFTVGCYQNYKGEVQLPIIMKRRLHNGHTVFAEIVTNEKISNYCIDITKKFSPMGPINIQLRLNEQGDPVCFEINVRFSGTTPIRDYFGFKDVVSMVHEKLHNTFNPSFFDSKYKGICYRVLEDVYFENGIVRLENLKHYE